MSDYITLCEKRAEEITKKTITSEERVVKEMNSKYAVIHTKSTYILVEKEDNTFVLDSRTSLMNLHENDFFIDSEGKQQNKAKFWLKHPDRRTYKNLVFDPTRPGHYDGNYNIFKGFTVAPQKGDCSLFWRHTLEVICAGNQIHFEYLRKWMACVIQKPSVLATAIVLRGLQGTGKNIFVETFGKLFGIHFLTLTNLDQVVGKFNSHLQNAYLIFANEAIWGGNKKEVGALKALITDKTIFIEAKGKDGYTIENNRHLIICSNEDWAVPIDLDDRRFFCLNVSPKYKGKTEYFKALVQQMQSGGLNALLYDLLHIDLSDFDPCIMPENDSGFDMKMKSASSAEQYVYEALKAGAWNLACSESAWEFGTRSCKGLHKDYRDWCDEEGMKPVNSSEFGKMLKKLFPSLQKGRPTLEGERCRCYIFPSLEKCREEFQQFTKQTAQIWEEVQDV
ncbi:MAG: hypothetical protein COT84_07575 [Chlamydiae bacterium CG10_big_fil_rev_8_21_14_0_10_35_9]|nr:MAG: hypothetical protein COT84_07575 [Chlamydiae bacterium CG10_big_fil_rev_8_21_14_0_10_35_9]